MHYSAHAGLSLTSAFEIMFYVSLCQKDNSDGFTDGGNVITVFFFIITDYNYLWNGIL